VPWYVSRAVQRLLAPLLLLVACAETSTPAAAAPNTDAWRSSAATYLDARVADWLADPPQVANFECAMSCHTTFPAVLAQSHLPREATPNIDEARRRFEARLSGDVTPFYGQGDDEKVGQSHATEAVLVAAALRYDAVPRPSSAPALARMWARQSPGGDWAWLDFGLEPWEHDGAFGVAMAALAAGDDTQGEGARRLREHAAGLTTTANLHDRAALLWASSRFDGLLDDTQAEAIATELRAVMQDDGGVALADLFGQQHAGPDGYATAWVTLALCSSGKAPDAARSGQAWLRAHQDRDGSWPGRSIDRTSRTAQQYMTDAATAYAVLALDCALDD